MTSVPGKGMDPRFNLTGVWNAVGLEAGESITETFLLHEGEHGQIVGSSLATDSSSETAESSCFDMEGATEDGVTVSLRQHFRPHPQASAATVCNWEARIVEGLDGRLELTDGKWSGDGISGSFTAARRPPDCNAAARNGL